jgi:hypothetical protein
MYWDLIEALVQRDIFRLPIHQELVGIVAEAEARVEVEFEVWVGAVV